ncbi:MAG: hypothetical protein LBF80_06975 [Spirochaetaceae bacterium]|jgi:uncharacterized protein (DUF2164 family)|nr:hypothetical protein [Spirochaetaceae bacterium]
MNYWDEVKRIQIKLKSALVIGTAEATGIIEGITGKLGYFFYVDGSVWHSDSRENIFRMIVGIEKKGGHEAEVAMLKDIYKDAKEYVAAEQLTAGEIADNAVAIEQVVRQLDVETDAYIKAHKAKGRA